MRLVEYWFFSLRRHARRWFSSESMLLPYLAALNKVHVVLKVYGFLVYVFNQLKLVYIR